MALHQRSFGASHLLGHSRCVLTKRPRRVTGRSLQRFEWSKREHGPFSDPAIGHIHRWVYLRLLHCPSCVRVSLCSCPQPSRHGCIFSGLQQLVRFCLVEQHSNLHCDGCGAAASADSSHGEVHTVFDRFLYILLDVALLCGSKERSPCGSPVHLCLRGAGNLENYSHWWHRESLDGDDLGLFVRARSLS
jgi:hypothetical protein